MNDSLENAFSSAGFVLRTQQQLAKDFLQHGFSFAADFDTTPYDTERLFQSVQSLLGIIAEDHPAKWMPLMYTLDIPETKYKRFFSGASSDWLPEFTWIVIRREALKVFFREKLR